MSLLDICNGWVHHAQCPSISVSSISAASHTLSLQAKVLPLNDTYIDSDISCCELLFFAMSYGVAH